MGVDESQINNPDIETYCYLLERKVVGSMGFTLRLGREGGMGKAKAEQKHLNKIRRSGFKKKNGKVDYIHLKGKSSIV